MPYNAIRHTQPYSFLQVPAEKGQPCSMSRSILELEETCYPSVCFDAFTQSRSAQLTCPLAWITSVPHSLPTTDPIYLYMVHSMGPSFGSQTAWHSTPQGKLILVYHRHPGPAILGLPSSEKLAVVNMNCAIMARQPDTHPAPVSTTVATTKSATAPEAAKSIRSTDDLIKEFPDLFKGIGRFPSEYKIWLCHDTHPMIHAPRKCPIALCPKVMEHLNKMEHLGVITHVDDPTDWVSSITYVQKANGKLHLCLDPCDLNKAIHHNHHKMPTMEEVAHEFAHSCFFTKLDAHHGYWSIVLDQHSSLLTTFNSPLEDTISCDFPLAWSVPKTSSRRRWIRSLKNAKDVLELQMTSPSMATPRTEHDAHLWDLMQTAHKYDLVFNPQKTHMKAQAINFFGCLYDANGVHPDPGKVDAVHTLPAPTNITKLQEFLGLATYLIPFIPGLSTLTAPLQELLKKDTDLVWNCTYNATFEWVMEAIISDTSLRYFDPSLPVTILVNASKVGLDAALLQNSKPVAFVSKALTKTEYWYANIERERC